MIILMSATLQRLLGKLGQAKVFSAEQCSFPWSFPKVVVGSISLRYILQQK